MSDNQQQLMERPTFGQLEVMAKAVSDSKMFGVENQAQALALMLLCQAEGLHPVMALRRYHIIDGKPAFRADALQGEFEKEGAILWHQRDEKVCAATFFRHQGRVDGDAIQRAKDRFKRLSANQDASDLAQVDEVTIIRTIEDAVEKKVAMRWDRAANKYVMKHSWQQSPRQMLHARCLTEGVRAINPGLIAGVYIEDEILDIHPEETNGHMDQRPPMEIVERNVRQATANATTDNDEIPGVPSPAPITDVTKDNYNDVVVHIGKAEGEMLGKKVGELHPNIVEWLYNKWRDKLSPFSDAKDLQLKTAVEFRYQELHTPEKVKAELGGGADFPHSSEASSPASSPEREKLIAELKDRCSDLVITETQACEYLRKEGVLNKEERFEDISTKMVQFILRPDMWQCLKDTVEADLKPPKVEGGPAKKTTKRARR